MAFPSNPSDGDTYIRYGRTYEYEAALSMWKVKQSGIQLNELSDVDVDTTAPSVGDTLVWSGTKFVPDEINLLSVYQSELPLAGNVAGQMAYVTDTSRLYIYTGAGWFNVALVNTNPTITVGPDGSYAFATDGTPIVLTLEAQDPEEVPIAWSYVVTSGALGSTATVQQEGNVFTITPSTDENDAGDFSITFTASDGVNLATAVSSFTLAFGTDDQYYNLNSLLLKSGSTAGLNNTIFVDESTNGLTVTPNGDVYQGSYSPYSPAGWSAYFDGTGDTLTLSADAFAFGSGDFTVEWWMNPAAEMKGVFRNTTYASAGATPGISAYKLTTDVLYVYVASVGSSAISGVPLNAWTHIAIVRSSGTVSVYVNGTFNHSFSSSGSVSTGETVRIGEWRNSTEYFTGYISDFRATNTVVYTSNFTPTERLTNISGTSLLTCQSPIFIDNSTNTYTITRNGDTKLLPLSPYLPSEQYDPTIHGGSAYFDGSGDWLDTSTSSALTFGTNDFTIEFWAYFTSISASTPNLIDMRGASQPSVRPTIYLNNGTLSYYTDGANRMTGGVLKANRWYHIACTKNGTVTRFFVNGVQTGTFNDFANYTCDKVRVFADDTGGGTAQAGYCSDVRVINGTALYTSDFTPPTQSLTEVSGTSLLLKMNNAGIYDETAKNNIQVIGDATTSTTQTKYSDTSVYFDGASDWIDLYYSENLILSSAFTIEAWVFLSSSQSNQTLVNMALPHNTLVISLNRGGSGRTYVYIGNGSSWTGAPAINSGSGNTIAINQWYHVALTSDGTTLRLFHNGIIVGTSATLPSGFQGYARIGAINTGSASEYFNGYMEDFRITKGVARYTANFTPPTAPLGFSNAE